MPSAIALDVPTQEPVLEFCEDTQELKSVASTKKLEELPRQQELKQMGVRVNDPELVTYSHTPLRVSEGFSTTLL
jgi:hypothetical protein